MGSAPRKMRVAGLGLRFLAGLIDAVTLLFVAGFLFAVWTRLLAVRLPRFDSGWWDALSQVPFEPDPFVLPGLGLAFLAGLALLYFETAYWHATVGQRLFGLSVVRPDGEPVGWSRALVRTVALGFSILYLFLGVLWIGFDRLRQGWHDRVAGTYVVQASGPRPPVLAFVRRSPRTRDA